MGCAFIEKCHTHLLNIKSVLLLSIYSFAKNPTRVHLYLKREVTTEQFAVLTPQMPCFWPFFLLIQFIISTKILSGYNAKAVDALKVAAKCT